MLYDTLIDFVGKYLAIGLCLGAVAHLLGHYVSLYRRS
jgi:hypothetical protein